MDNEESLRQAVSVAEARYASGQFSLALEYYRDTVIKRLVEVASRNSRWWAADAIAIERLADLAILDGSPSAARNLLMGLHDIYLQESNRFAACYVAIKLSHLALETDDVSQAHAGLRGLKDVIGDLESIDLSVNGLHAWESEIDWPNQDDDSKSALLTRLYLVMGGILASYGQFHDAIQCFERGEAIACSSQVPSISQVCVPLRISLSAACLALGQFARCQDWLARAQSEQPPQNPALLIRLQELRGKRLLMEGRYGEALDAYYLLLTNSMALGFTRPIAVASLNFAHLLILLNQTQNALEYIQNAESAASNDPSLLKRAQVLRALAYNRRESLADHVAISPSVSEMWTGSQPAKSINDPHHDKFADPLDLPVPVDFLSFFEDRALAVQWRLSHEQFDEAAELMETLGNVFLLGDSPLIHARLKALQGMVDYYIGNIAEAARLLTEAANEQQALGVLPEAWQSKRVLSWCYSRLGKPVNEITRLDLEVQEDLEKLSLSLPKVDRSSFLLNKWTATEEYFLGEVDMIVDLTRQSQARPLWRRPFMSYAIMKRLNLLLERINRHKFESSSQFLGIRGEDAEISNIKTTALWKRLLFHPMRSASINFLVLPDRVLIIQQSWLRMGFGVSAITRGDLRDLVSGWYKTANKFGEGRDLGAPCTKENSKKIDDTMKHTLNRLGEALQLQPLLDNLPKRVKSLRIAPDDSLLGFPFSVLNYRGKALPQSFAVSILFPHEETKTMPSKRTKHALLVGISDGSDAFAPLPHVEQEINAVHKWSLRRGYEVERLMNAIADKTSIIKALKRSNLLHIACHGVFRTDKPGNTGFVLLPDGNKVQILSLLDLTRLELNTLEHATLSSCWAADRFILPGRQTIGLPETLIRCGANSVLSNLWPLDDHMAACFTDQFYNYLEHLPRDEALRRTQQDCILGKLPLARKELNTSSPIYWAGFNLYGSNTAI